MEKRVLSIQSHVVYGYVGNKAAIFPLQVLGYDVDIINSVQLSNHCGYKVFKGQKLNSTDLGDLIDGLSQNGLDNYSHILTGFANSAEFLSGIAEVVQRFKARDKNIQYVCDPVLGDNKKMYVPQETLKVYQEKILPLADIILPNKYELEWLIGKEVNNFSELLDGINDLHKTGSKVVVVTSVEFSKDVLNVVASKKYGETNEIAVVEVHKIPCYATGTGDLFSALFLAWMDKSNNDVLVSLENTINTIQGVLCRTWNYSKAKKFSSSEEMLELRLIQSKCDIENPKREYKAKML